MTQGENKSVHYNIVKAFGIQWSISKFVVIFIINLKLETFLTPRITKLHFISDKNTNINPSVMVVQPMNANHVYGY